MSTRLLRRAHARHPGWVLLALAVLVLLGGCATGFPHGSLTSGFSPHSRSAPSRSMEPAGGAGGFPEPQVESAPVASLTCGGVAVPPGWPDLSSSETEALLTPFLSCTSPAEFIALQERVDMPRLVEKLEDSRAVRLSALGPVREDTATLLNRKRASFLVTATERYGLPHAEVLALFLLHSAHDDEVREVLRLLAGDKRLGQTLGLMPAVREELEARGLPLSDWPDRPEQTGDVLRGLGRAARDALSSSPLSEGARYMELSALQEQLPPAYQRAHHEVERTLVERHFSPGNVVLGGFDSLTFGVPLGFYSLVTSTGHGVYALSQGQYEQATRELAPAGLLVALYTGGKGLRALSETRGIGLRGLPSPELRLRALQEVVRQLESGLGADALGELARHIRANREAGRFVAVGGVDAALALREARGDVARAQAWLSQARPERTGTPAVRGGAGTGPGEVASVADDAARSTAKSARAGKPPGGLSSLVDEEAGLTPEVVEAKLARVELDSTGPRLSGSISVLEKQRPALAAPPPEAQGHPLWSEYVPYWENRLAELKHGKAVKPPLAWEGYGQMRGLFARGLAFERLMVSLLRADATLPRAMRRFLKDFNQPRIETNVGVSKPGTPGVRFADVLVIEEQRLPGQLPRVETFSFKSRDLSLLREKALTAQMQADAQEALRYYGETLNIRRASLGLLDKQVPVHRVRLIYEGGVLKPKNVKVLDKAVEDAREKVKGVEVLFQ